MFVLIMTVVVGVPLLALLVATISNANDSRRAGEEGAQTKARQLAEKEQEAALAIKREAFVAKTIPGWQFVARALLDEVPALVAMDKTGMLLRIVKHNEIGDFDKIDDVTLNVRSIVSMDVYIAKGSRAVSRTQRVPVQTLHNKNAVGRGILGAVVAGPVGAVVGAASGIGSKVESSFENKTTYETISVNKPSVLVLGTNRPEMPVLRIQFVPSKLSSEWYYRIQAAQAAKR